MQTDCGFILPKTGLTPHRAGSLRHYIARDGPDVVSADSLRQHPVRDGTGGRKEDSRRNLCYNKLVLDSAGNGDADGPFLKGAAASISMEKI